MRGVARAVFVALVLVAAPHVSSAQGLGSIAGVVRDTSGGVLPGVTVEVTSPVLIEKVRTAVTDGSGLYTIVSLPVGTAGSLGSWPCDHGHNRHVTRLRSGVLPARGALWDKSRHTPRRHNRRSIKTSNQGSNPQ